MRAVVQRVKEARVTVDGEIIGAIKNGLLILLGISQDDTEDSIPWLVDKVINLRIFNDDQGKMNLSVHEVEGELLIVSQFTLYGNCKRGRRPSYSQAASPEKALALYQQFVAEAKKKGLKVASGQFGAYMQIMSINDGPVTLIVDSLC